MKLLMKRAMRRSAVFVLLLLAPIAAVRVVSAEGQPPAGFYMEAADPASARVAEHLRNNGFTEFSDADDIAALVQSGELDCGAVFPDDFGVRIAEGDLENCIAFYTSPTSYSPALYQNHVAAAVFREYAPYISADAFDGSGVSRKEVLAAYEAMFADGYIFSFDLKTVSGAPLPENAKARGLAVGTAAILQFVALFALCGEIVESSFQKILPRIGLRRSVTAVLLPESILNTLLAAAACSVGISAAGFPDYALPVVLHGFLMAGSGLFLIALLRSAKRIYVLLPVLMAGSVALCPVYIDLALVIPAAGTVRNLLPAYWLWLIPEAPGLWALLSAAVFAAGILSVALARSARVQIPPSK